MQQEQRPRVNVTSATRKKSGPPWDTAPTVPEGTHTTQDLHTPGPSSSSQRVYGLRRALSPPSPPSPREVSSRPPSPDSDDSDGESLPEFWEEVWLSDDKVIYVDHRTETTTWERPRGHSTRKFKLTDPELAWTARLETPRRERSDSLEGQSPSSDSGHPAPSPPSGGPIADLLRDGYILGDANTDFSDAGSVPDFWEIYKGDDDYTYYIDHPAGIILRST